jgi:hypothetical protein
VQFERVDREQSAGAHVEPDIGILGHAREKVVLPVGRLRPSDGRRRPTVAAASLISWSLWSVAGLKYSINQLVSWVVFAPSRPWVERQYTDLRYWNEVDRGGHFAAFEQPGRYVDEVRKFFRLLR